MLFRPDDSKPLDLLEEEEWDKMLEMGRTRYIATRTGSVLANSILPIGLTVWGLWWMPQTRPYITGPFTIIPLAIGTALLGSLSAAYAWDTWRSYERRSLLESDKAPIDKVDWLMVRTRHYSLRAAIISTIAVGIVSLVRSPLWLTAMMGGVCAMSWRSVILQQRRRHLFQPKK